MGEDTSLAIPQTVKLSIRPQQARKDASAAVLYLKELLDQKKKKVIINGKRHIEFDDWIALGNVYGIDVKTHDAEPVEVFGVQGAKAKADVIRIEDGAVIGGAEAYCLSNERNWRGKPFFQMASMAQTRAGSKALSNALRWVVAVEGISGTPAEEIINVDNENEETNSKPSQNSKSGNKPSQNKPKPTQNKPKPTQNKAEDDDPVVDAEFQVKTKTTNTGDEVDTEAKVDETPETVDMSGVDLTKIKGINEELDRWIHTVEDVGVTQKEVLKQCQDLLGKELEMTEFKAVKKALGMQVK